MGFTPLLAYPTRMVNMWNPLGANPGAYIDNNILIQYGHQQITKAMTTTNRILARRISLDCESFFFSFVVVKYLVFLLDFLAVQNIRILQTVMTMNGPPKQQLIIKIAYDGASVQSQKQKDWMGMYAYDAQPNRGGNDITKAKV